MNARIANCTKQRRPRGSVLIFAVVFLVILAGLGTAFVMFVIQQSRASANTLHGTEADAVGDAALAHARQVLRQAIGQYSCFSPDATFDPTRFSEDLSSELPYYQNTHAKAALIQIVGTADYFCPTPAPDDNVSSTSIGDFVNAGTDGIMQCGIDKTVSNDVPLNLGNVFRTFEAYEDERTVDPSKVKQGLYALLYYSDSSPYYYDPSLYADPAEPSVPLRFTEGVLTTHCGLNGTPLKYFENTSLTVEGPTHYGLARKWRVNSPQDGIYGTKKARDLPRVANTRGEYYVWIDNLDGKLFANPQEWPITVPSTYTKTSDQVRAGIVKALGLAIGSNEEINLLTKIVPGTEFTDVADLAQRIAANGEALDRVAGPGGATYLYARHTLDRYFNFKRDHSLKAYEHGLNINTAPFDLIVAALSEIPLVPLDPTDPTSPYIPDPYVDTANPGKAYCLAARICAKRPFLCRVDFEDFLAAHLNSDTDETAPADNISVDPPATAVGAIYRAIPLREYPSLTEMMEIFNGATLVPFSDDHPIFNVLRKADYQQKRFAWFREDDSVAPRAKAYIDLKAFNNLLNSLSGQRRDGKFGFSFYSSGRVKTERVTALGNLPSGIPEIEHNYEIDSPFRYVFKDSTGTRWDLLPKFEFNRLTQTQIDAGQTKYQFGSSAADPGALCHWHATDSSGYYEVTFGSSEDEQKKEFASVVPNPVPPATPEPFVLLGAAPNTPAASALTPAAGDDTAVGSEILDGAAGTGDTFVQTTIHSPIRTYRLPSPFDASIPAPTATVADGLNGDVAWSPRADFRGRYFKVYVLARGIVTISKDPSSGVQTTHYGATRRIEALYDALDDELLWRRNVSTELRSLGDPSP